MNTPFLLVPADILSGQQLLSICCRRLHV